MMTTAQLSRSIARHLDVDDPSNLNDQAALDVLNAINAGIQRFYTEAPANLTRLTLSATFRAPQRIPGVTFTSQYAKTVTGTPFDPSWYGCGIQFDGVLTPNQIRGTNTVLDEWILPNLTVGAQLYHDAFVMQVQIERIVSDVRLHSPQWTTPRVLTRNEAVFSRRPFEPNGVASSIRPSYYRMEPVDYAAQGSVTSLLRIFPAPLTDVTARFEADIAVSPIGMDDLVNGAPIPVADAWSGFLTAICEGELTYSPLWKDKTTKKEIRDYATEVLENRVRKLPNDLAAPNNTVGTPWGF